MDKETLFNWIGDPGGSSVDWLNDHLVSRLHRSPMVAVPDLHGMSVVQARQALVQTGLRIKLAYPTGQPRLGTSVVVRQEPAPGRSMRRRSMVTVYVGDAHADPSAYA